MSGMTVHKGGKAGRAAAGGRESGLEPHAYLLWLRVRDSGSAFVLAANLEKNIAEEVGAVAGGGRQGTAVDSGNPFSVRGHRGLLIAHGR